MNLLRVLLDAAPAADRESDWALFDAGGRVLRQGRARPDAWPAADAREAIVTAAVGRVVTLALPPLPLQRVAAAAAFALEDQLAGAPEDSHAAFSAQSSNGDVRAVVIADSWMWAFAAASARLSLRWQRIVLESDLARAPESGWCWCADAIDSAGFVRTDRGTTIAVGPARLRSTPEELISALSTGSRKPGLVRVDIDGADAALLADGKRRSGVEFVAGSPWRWHAAAASTFAAAVDLQTGRFDTTPKAAEIRALRVFRPALWIAGAALALQLLANTGSWLWLRWQSNSVQSEMAALARSAAPDASPDLAPTVAIARKDAALRHRAGLSAQDDALPLLARAAPALTALPAGAVRSLHYVDGHIVFELQKTDAASSTRLQRALQAMGMTAIAVPTAGGERLRVGLD